MPVSASDEIASKTNPKTGLKTSPKTGLKTSPKSVSSQLGKTAQAILDLLSEDPYMRREELMKRLGLSLGGIKYQLANLQKERFLQRIEGRKSGHWKILVKK